MPGRSLASLLVFRARKVLSSLLIESDNTSIPLLALLVDGENIPSEMAVHLLAAAGNIGGVSIRRVYGNWRHPALSSWQTAANHYGFQTIHAAHPVSGKNATDITLTVDAMDLLYQGLRHFCLASSDTDYIPLVRRLREKNSFVLGIGRSDASEALKTAYNAFLTMDQLVPSLARANPNTPPPQEKGFEIASSVLPTKDNGKKQEGAIIAPSDLDEKDKILIALLIQAYNQARAKGKNEWVSTVQLGTILQQLQPGFTPKSYGSAKLKGLIQKYPHVFQTQPLKGGQIALRIKSK